MDIKVLQQNYQHSSGKVPYFVKHLAQSSYTKELNNDRHARENYFSYHDHPDNYQLDILNKNMDSRNDFYLPPGVKYTNFIRERRRHLLGQTRHSYHGILRRLLSPPHGQECFDADTVPRISGQNRAGHLATSEFLNKWMDIADLYRKMLNINTRTTQHMEVDSSRTSEGSILKNLLISKENYLLQRPYSNWYNDSSLASSVAEQDGLRKTAALLASEPTRPSSEGEANNSHHFSTYRHEDFAEDVFQHRFTAHAKAADDGHIVTAGDLQTPECHRRNKMTNMKEKDVLQLLSSHENMEAVHVKTQGSDLILEKCHIKSMDLNYM